jgi:hypothetical protein
MEKANFELSQGKQGFSSSPTFSFLEAVYKEASSVQVWPAVSCWRLTSEKLSLLLERQSISVAYGSIGSKIFLLTGEALPIAKKL